jgi:outer membrane murein-binding lipoprotein Lpp
MAKVRGWVAKRPITWVLVAVVVGAIIGAAGTSSEKDQLEKDKTHLKAQLSSAQDQVDRLETEQDQTAQKEARLNAREASLDKRAQKITASEQTIEQNTITDGIWQVGKDFEAGTYRAPGGGSCYWALLNSANTQDIVNNGGFGPNQTLTIDSAWFETSDCGDWTKVG